MDPSNNFRKETMRPSNWSGLSKLSFWKMAVTLLALCGATAISSAAQTLTTLHTFAGYSTDGASPYAGLVQATDGNFYGTTYAGGTSGNCQGGCGTVFRITPGGTLTTLHSFDWYDGASPTGALVQGNDGNFYGTTYGGGAEPRVGTVFKITPGGALTTLYSFCAQANCTDGQQPYAGLVRGHRWELLRDNLGGRGQHRLFSRQRQLRHGLQNHARGRADHAVQLLRSTWLH